MSVRRFGERYDLETAERDDVEAWLGGLRKKSGAPLTPQTRGMYLADLRAFYDWAVDHEHYLVDPTLKLRRPKRPNYVPRPIPMKALKAAIDAAPARERVMLTLAGFGGLRCAEIAGLKLEDIDHDTMTIRVLGKGQKTRIVRMHAEVAALIPRDQVGPVISWAGKPVSARAVSDRLARYLRRFGIDATGHQARHSYGTRLYEVSHNLLTVSAQMGHSSTQTTKAYVAFSDDDAKDAILKF